MARGASQSQTTSSSSSSRAGVTAPRGSAAATAGMRRRRVVSSGSSSGGGGGSVTGGPTGNILRFYTDDAPGLKISPTIVLVISLCFIGFVTALHVFGKLYRSKHSKSNPTVQILMGRVGSLLLRCSCYRCVCWSACHRQKIMF
ncbi:protein transport protein Sec [Salix suchowensis]|nr:protein transport protein Sec [Salix suchowensis]